jgi:hypothetical protein
LAGCGGDGIKDENFDKTMLREAMCVAASERFFLYKEASLHLEHGLSAGKLRFDRHGDENDFTKLVLESRKLLTALSPTFNAKILKEDCNRAISNGEFSRGS